MTNSHTSASLTSQIVITGLGAIAAGGSDVAELWRNLAAGKINCGPIPVYLFRTILNYPVFAAPQNCLSAKARALLAETCPGFRAESVSRTILLALTAAAEALQQAGIGAAELRNLRVGVVLGTTVGCTFHNEEYYIAWRDGLAPDLAPVHYYLGGNVAAALHRLLGTSGPAAVVTNACASGSDAIGIGRNWLAAGQCDLVIAGGADELSRVAYNGFASLMLADTVACRPFSHDRQGLNLGEGAGVLLMERQDGAMARGGRVLGWVRGYGCAADAHHPTAPHPEGRGLKTALAQALREAGAGEIVLVNAHGTGTKANDQAETAALAAALPGVSAAAIVSTKGFTGHTLGAAGGLEAIFTLLALRDGYTPGTVGCRELDPAFAVRPLRQNEGRSLPGRLGLSQSLAFGGGNAVLILEAAL
ncbi:MAG: beta-ketoacyl-[acyl-carrier-protein] synthase family protein [Desulfobulbaceae bacterium]|nr:beta-ketoacyl-[acyl-carrier-protein] synthase family protein [Desulfobulbaceae bacterium]